MRPRNPIYDGFLFLAPCPQVNPIMAFRRASTPPIHPFMSLSLFSLSSVIVVQLLSPVDSRSLSNSPLIRLSVRFPPLVGRPSCRTATLMGPDPPSSFVLCSPLLETFPCQTRACAKGSQNSGTIRYLQYPHPPKHPQTDARFRRLVVESNRRQASFRKWTQCLQPAPASGITSGIDICTPHQGADARVPLVPAFISTCLSIQFHYPVHSTPSPPSRISNFFRLVISMCQRDTHV